MNMNEINISKVRQEIIGSIAKTLKYNEQTDASILFKVLEDILYAMNESTNITITNNDGTIIYVNDSFCKLSQYDREEVMGKKLQQVNGYIQSKSLYEDIASTILNGKSWRGEVQHIAKDGTSYWTLSTIVPFTNIETNEAHFISFQTDITEKKRVETQFKSSFIKTFQNLQNGIFKIRREPNGSLKYTMSEGRLMESIGATIQDMYLKSPFEVFQPEVAEIKYKYYLQAFEGNRVHYELEINGVLIYVDLEPIKQNGIVTEVVGTVHDFSEFRDVQKQLKVNEERYQSIINHSHEHIIMLDKNGVIKHMNPKTMQLFGVIGRPFRNIHIVEATIERKKKFIEHYFNKVLNGEIQFFEFDVQNNNQTTYLNVMLIPIIIDNEIDAVYAMGTDITKEKEIQELNAYLAHHDELTGLPNRRWMERKIQQSVENKKDEQKINQLAILSLDLDRFKFVNDTLGHVVGDKLLQQIANRLREHVVENKIYAARMGGDEFMVLCHHLCVEEVTNVARNILKSLEQPFYIEGYELMITASIGIMIEDLENANVIEMMKKVDIALYKSKELGRNMYQIYDSTMKSENYQMFMMERDLRKAIMNDELIAYFQPKVDALTGKTIGAEALIRWNHPERGLISPGQFIPIAEETGLIIPIGKWMKRKVCDQLVKWKNAGLSLIPISINISSNRLLQQEFAEEIGDLLTEFQLEGQWLEIEITENSIMRNEEAVQKTLKALKEMGVKVYIDDFGTGYSSFNYLKTFELDGIKIDRSFIQDISSIPENASITSAMINMAQHLKLEVIAEGVETKDELDYLLEQGCHLIQGFYFGKPCPIEQFEHNYMRYE